MADVAANLKDWSTTASSNSPGDSTIVGAGLADNFQEIQKVVRQDLAHKGADIASAGTTDLGAVPGLFHDITGTTTITSFGTVSAGIWKIVKFEGVLTLTHNATSLILPGGANITTAVGDVGIFVSEGGGNWRCVSYLKASGALFDAANVAITGGSISGITDLAIADGGTGASTAADAFANLKQAASDTATGVVEIAVQSEMEAGTDTTRAVTPGRQHYHKSAAKAWVYFTQSAGVVTIQASYNVSSVVRNANGDYTVNWTNAFSSAAYAVSVLQDADRSTVQQQSQLAGSFRFWCLRTIDLSNQDPSNCHVIAFGT